MFREIVGILPPRAERRPPWGPRMYVYVPLILLLTAPKSRASALCELSAQAHCILL